VLSAMIGQSNHLDLPASLQHLRGILDIASLLFGAVVTSCAHAQARNANPGAPPSV
jgi:hypothetical protein